MYVNRSDIISKYWNYKMEDGRISTASNIIDIYYSNSV